MMPFTPAHVLSILAMVAGCTGDGASWPDLRDAGQPPPPGDAPEDGDHGSITADAGTEPEDGVLDAGAPDAGALDAGAPDAGAQRDAGMVTVGTGGVVESTIIVRAGETFDGAGEHYQAGPELGDGSQDEDQQPIFRLEDGARLVNVRLGAPAADGIHTYGNVTLSNIVWEDIGEDALTIKAPGTVILEGGSATNGDDKVFQINAPSEFRVSDFEASHAGKFIRQNGGTTFKVQVFIDRCDISAMDESIFRTDSDTSTVSMSSTRYSNIGEELFIGVRPENITTMDNTEY